MNLKNQLSRQISQCKRYLTTIALVHLALASFASHAEIVFEKANYQSNNVNFVGQWAYDNSLSAPLPAILMGPTWTGPGEYT